MIAVLSLSLSLSLSLYLSVLYLQYSTLVQYCKYSAEGAGDLNV